MAAERAATDAQNMQHTPEDVALWAQALLGIRSYQNFPQDPVALPSETLWAQGALRLRRAAGMRKPKKGAPVVLMVPSLINRAAILDLSAERSLQRYLLAQGLDAVLLDWGDVKTDPLLQDLESLVCKGLLPALRFLRQTSGQPIYLLGYCMGGTLSVAAMQLAAQDVAGTVFLATPWNFEGRLARLVQFWAPTALPHIHAHNYLPSDWMQTVFAALEPQQSVRKFARFAGMDPQGAAAQLFVAVEDWLNDGVDLPAGAALNCIKDWFIENAPVRGHWRIGGETIRPQNIVAPCLVVTAQKDRLVEPHSARPLAQQIPGAQALSSDCGHIGLIAGARAVEEVWQPIAHWIETQHYAHRE